MDHNDHDRFEDQRDFVDAREFKDFTKPPPPPPPTPGMAINAIVTVLVVVAIGVVIILVSRGINKVKSLATEENQALAEIAMLVNFADITSVSEMAVPVTAADVAADPESHTGKWLALTGNVNWLMDEKSGDSVAPGQAQAGDFIYWLDGPVIVKDHRDDPPGFGPGNALRAYGRCLVVEVENLGLSPDGLRALLAMEGFNGNTAVMLIAKWIEAP